MFAIRGDGGWYYNIPGRPIFDPLSALLMLIGIALVLRRFRQPAYGFIVMWLIVMFVPSLLAVQGTPKSPQGHRDYPGHLHLAGNRRHLALGSLGVARAEETTVPTGLARDAGISSWNIPYLSELLRTVGETSRTHRCFQRGPDGYSSGCPQNGKCRLEDDFRGWWRLL